MANKKDNSNKSSDSRPKNAVKKSPSIKKKIPKNILQFENLISGFSAALIDTPHESLESELKSWLKKFVEFLKVDRCIVNEYLDDKKAIHLLMNYTVPEIDNIAVVNNFKPSSGVIRELEKGIIIKAEKIPEDLPRMFRGCVIEKDKTRSVIIVPLITDNKVIGSLAFSCYRKERKWSDDIIRRIKLIGEIITNAILRIRSHKSLYQEMELRKTLENRYSTILKYANVGFVISDLNHKILEVNEEYCRMSGYSRDEILAKKIWEIDASTDPEKLVKEGQELEKNKVIRITTSHIRKDGTLFDVEVNGTLLKEEGIACTFVRDITDLNRTRKELEERLEFEELISEFSTELVNIAPDLIYYELEKWLKKFVEFLQVDRGIVNEHLYEENLIHLLLNYTVPGIDISLTPYHKIPSGIREDFIKGISVKAEKIPDNLPGGLRGGLVEKENAKSVIIIPIIASNEVIGNLTFLSYKKERKWPDDLVRRIKLIGEIVGNAILRNRSHDALIEEMEQRKLLEERYTSVIKNAGLGFMVSDMNSMILDVNEAYCEMSGYSHDELLGMSVENIDASLLDQNKLTLEKKEILKKSGLFIETNHRRKDGTIIDVALTSNFLEKEELIFNFIRDITESNQVKKEQLERLEFEEVVSEFSTALINIKPDDIVNELEKWLEKFVGLIDADRGAVNEYSDDQQIIKNLIQYSVPEVNTHIPDLRKNPEGEIIELEKGIIRAEKIPEDLPQMFRGSFIEKSKAKSLIIVPLLTGNRIFGNLAFTNYRKERKWSDELIRRIKLIGEIVGNAILRLRSHEALVEEMGLRQRLEEKYTSIIKTANVGFWISDMNAKILEVNDAYCKMSGYSRDELLGMTIDQIDLSLNPEHITYDTNRILASGEFNIEASHTRKDGKIIEVAVNSSVLEKEGIIFTFIRDITELNKIRRDLEDRLKFEELNSQFSAALVNVKPDYINEELNRWVKKFVEFLKVDRGIFHEYDYDNHTINVLVSYTDPDVNLVVSPLRESHMAPDEIMKEFAKGIVIRAEKVPGDLPPLFQGGILERHNTKSIVIVPLTAGDQVIGNLTFVNYINEHEWPDELVRRIKLIGEIVAHAILRIRSHEALLEEMERREMLEERYSSIIKTANVGFMISDLNASILEVNNAYCEMSGYSRDELLGMKIYQLDISGSPDKVDTDKDGIFETGSFHHETSHIRKDGKIIKVLISANFLEKEGIIFSFVRDVTELNIAREDLEDRLKFEELTSEFSAALINLKLDNIDEDLNPWIKKFAEFFEVEIGIINEYDYDKKTVKAVGAYTDPDVDVPPSDKSSQAPGLIMQKLAKGDVIRAEKITEDLPPVFNEGIVKGHKTKSILIVPLSAESQVIGNLTFATYTREHKWSDEFLRRVRLVGEIIANAILRKRSSDSLIEEMKSRHMLEEKYTSIIKNASVGFTISDYDQNILDVNDEYCRMSGYTYDELTKMKISDIDFSESPEKVDNDIAMTVDGGLYHHQTKHIRKDGSIFDVDVQSQYSESERFFFSFVRDVTELNKARRELEERLKLEELVSEFSAALINVKIEDVRAELDIWLKKFAEFLGVDKFCLGEYEDNYRMYRFICTYINPKLDPQPPPFSPAPVRPDGFAEYLKNGEAIIIEDLDKASQRFPAQLVNKLYEDGTKSLLEFPLISDDVLLGTMIISSMSSEKIWSQELVRELKLVAEIFANALIRDKRDYELDNYRKGLEKMVDERTVELKEAQKELVMSEKMATLGRLTATVSHELRNPLGTIRSSVFSFQKRYKGQDKKMINALERMERNIKRCDLIIDDLLNYSRVHDLHLEPTSIDEWLNEVLEETIPPAEGISIKKELNSSVIVNMDQERFRRSMVNILTNAYQSIQEKEIDEPGFVCVKTYKDIEKLIIEITDNGVGFDMENKSKIFEPLYSTKTFGIGLGIPITRQIIEQHGWKMDITGEPQKGASVIITIPV